MLVKKKKTKRIQKQKQSQIGLDQCANHITIYFYARISDKSNYIHKTYISLSLCVLLILQFFDVQR